MTPEELEARLKIIGISAEALALRAGRARSAGARWRTEDATIPEAIAAWVTRISDVIAADPVPILPPYVPSPPGRRKRDG